MDLKCRLCCMSSTENSYNLFDINGQCTEVHKITVKYFDPMLFVGNSEDVTPNQSTILCPVCWKHIKEFYEFQQNVLSTQCRLSENVKQLLTEVKEESDNNSINEEFLSELDDVKMEFEDADKEVLDCLDVADDDKEVVDCLKVGDKQCSDDTEADITPSTLIEKEKPCFRVKLRSQILKENCRRKKSSVKVAKTKDINASKDSSYNSAAKIQELDNFIADVSPKLECDICKQEFTNYDLLRTHFSEDHGTKVFVVCCRKKFYRRYLLVDHLRLHVNPETFKCDICGAVSTSSRTLKAHKHFMHSLSKTLKCEICQRTFKNKSTLTRHEATHAKGKKDFKCEQCERSYVFEFQLKTHITKVHNETKICDQCGKTVNGFAALKQHLLQHSDTKLPKWPCDQCDAQLASHKGLKSHKLSFHNDGTTAFICKECGRITSSENALLRHKRYVHTLERKYQCPFCEKAFKRKSTLKEHIATHTGQHLYQCNHCSQTFNNNANMHKHRKRAHPLEWAESRQNRLEVPKVNADNIVKEVVL